MVRDLYIHEQQEEGFTARCRTRTGGLQLTLSDWWIQSKYKDISIIKLWTLPRMSTSSSLNKKCSGKLIYKNGVIEGHYTYQSIPSVVSHCPWLVRAPVFCSCTWLLLGFLLCSSGGLIKGPDGCQRQDLPLLGCGSGLTVCTASPPLPGFIAH